MRIVSLNVERSAHLDRFIPFLSAHAPDVALLQELVESDIERIQAATGLTYCHFAAMARISRDDAPFGVGILSRHRFSTTGMSVYAGGGDGGMIVDRASPESRLATIRYPAVRVRLAGGDCQAEIATVHFP